MPEADDNPIRSLINNIPLESDDEDAPVGVRRRRKLVKKGGYDPDTGCGINTFDLTGDDEAEEKVSDEDIEADRKKIEKAAKDLGCKKMVVKVNRREEITEDGWELRESGADRETGAPVLEKNARGILSVLDDSESDEEELVARPPGAAVPRVEEAHVGTGRSGSEDAMEVIQGEDLGRVDHRRYRNVTEEVIRWRVPGMKSEVS